VTCIFLSVLGSCEVCHQQAYIQKLGNYYRCRHYAGKDPKTGKAKFYYHQQTKEYAENQLALIEKQRNLKQQPLEHLNNADQCNLEDLGSVSSGRSPAWLGHQPPTLTTRVQISATALPFHFDSIPHLSIRWEHAQTNRNIRVRQDIRKHHEAPQGSA
jgi:hypothetical protein